MSDTKSKKRIGRPQLGNDIDAHLLKQLWEDSSKSVDDIASLIGFSSGVVRAVASRRGLGKRLCTKTRIYAVGEKVGNWTLIEYLGTGRGSGSARWKCQCDCGATKFYDSDSLATRKKICEYCKRKNKEMDADIFTRLAEVRKSGEVVDRAVPLWYIRRLTNNATRSTKLKDYALSDAYLESLIRSQDWKCAMLGWPIEFGKTVTGGRSTTASLDRIDSAVGYVEGNVQWVHKAYNFMKGCRDQQEVDTVCMARAKALGWHPPPSGDLAA